MSQPSIAIQALLALLLSMMVPLYCRCESVKLPEPDTVGTTPLEFALATRRSIRTIGDRALTLTHISQLLWAGQGISSPGGYRTAPSAGALYPLTLYLVLGSGQPLASGVYRYSPSDHALELITPGDARKALSAAALTQVPTAPGIIVITADYAKTTAKYQDRGNRYVHIEAGAVSENIYLQATVLGLATFYIGAFDDKDVQKAIGVKEEPLGLLPIGYKP